MTTPLSIRFDPDVLSRLRDRAHATPGATASGLAQLLVDEGLRMADHPGVVFKDGPSGRRASLASGPDIAEVITALREVDRRGEKAVDMVSDQLNLPLLQVEVALRYHAAYPAEIDAEIDAREAASIAAEREWHARQRLLA